MLSGPVAEVPPDESPTYLEGDRDGFSISGGCIIEINPRYIHAAHAILYRKRYYSEHYIIIVFLLEYLL